jgi:hypothetical protein
MSTREFECDDDQNSSSPSALTLDKLEKMFSSVIDMANNVSQMKDSVKATLKMARKSIKKASKRDEKYENVKHSRDIESPEPKIKHSNKKESPEPKIKHSHKNESSEPTIKHQATSKTQDAIISKHDSTSKKLYIVGENWGSGPLSAIHFKDSEHAKKSIEGWECVLISDSAFKIKGDPDEVFAVVSSSSQLGIYNSCLGVFVDKQDAINCAQEVNHIIDIDNIQFEGVQDNEEDLPQYFVVDMPVETLLG